MGQTYKDHCEQRLHCEQRDYCMFNSEFQAFCGTYEQHNCDVYLGALRTENDAIKAIIFPQINIGVYQNGFGKYQAYNVTTAGVFDGRDMVAQILCSKCYLTGNILCSWQVVT